MTFSRKIRDIKFNDNVDNSILIRPDVVRDFEIIFDPKFLFDSPHQLVVLWVLLFAMDVNSMILNLSNYCT